MILSCVLSSICFLQQSLHSDIHKLQSSIYCVEGWCSQRKDWCCLCWPGLLTSCMQLMQHIKAYVLDLHILLASLTSCRINDTTLSNMLV